MKSALITLGTLATLGLAFTPGCEGDTDPLVGDWRLVRIDDIPFPTSYTDDYGCSIRASLQVEVEDDLDGEGRWDYFDTCEGSDVVPVFFEVDPEGDGDYQIEVREAGGFWFLDCELDGDELECFDEDLSLWVFRRI